MASDLTIKRAGLRAMLFWTVCMAWAGSADLSATDSDLYSYVEHLDVVATYSDGYRAWFDIRYPTQAPSPRGWPLIVIVHGLGGCKEENVDVALTFTEWGYVTVCNDVRGQGRSMDALNDPGLYGWTGMGERERLDLAELMETVEALYPAYVDFTRIGVCGDSQGGLHSYVAAAHSGKTLPYSGKRFPDVMAVSPGNYIPNFHEVNVPEGRNVHDRTVDTLRASPGLHWEPTFKTAISDFVLAEDYLGLREALDDPLLNLETLLMDSTVPMFVRMSYDDYWMHPNGVIRIWNDLPADMPRKLYVSTCGHGSPPNYPEKGRKELAMLAFFDRHLKKSEHAIDNDPPIGYAVTPDEMERYTSPFSLWDTRKVNQIVPSSVMTDIWYLESNQVLSDTPPVNSSAFDQLVHQPPGWFDVDDYVATVLEPQDLFDIVDFCSLPYYTPVLSEDCHLLGIPKAELYVSTTSTRFLVHAALVDVDTEGGERYITGGFTTIRDNLLPGDNTISLELGFCSYMVRQGHRLALRIENLAWHRPSMESAETIRVLPVFEPSLVEVKRDATHPSSISISLLPLEGPHLGVYPQILFGSHLIEGMIVTLYSNSSYAYKEYWVLPGQSGFAPGTQWGSVLVPLNVDDLTRWVLGTPNTPPFYDFNGLLDKTGTREAFLDIQALMPLTRPQLCFDAVIIKQGTVVSEATDPVVVDFVP